jgi:hypothetical protein
MYQMNLGNPGMFGLPYEPEALIVCRRNLLMNNTNPPGRDVETDSVYCGLQYPS